MNAAKADFPQLRALMLLTCSVSVSTGRSPLTGGGPSAVSSSGTEAREAGSAKRGIPVAVQVPVGGELDGVGRGVARCAGGLS